MSFTALPNNPKHYEALLSQLNLGSVTNTITPVFGGFHHKMWRLETTTGTYAIKQLAPDTDVNNSSLCLHFNATEAAAETFEQHNIISIHALKNNDRYLQIIDQSAYLVYPWTEAKALDKSAVIDEHALTVAKLLAKMHQANIQVDGISEAQFEVVNPQQLREVFAQSLSNNGYCSALLNENLNEFIHIAQAQAHAVSVLQHELVVSHGDLDQKNILWLNDTPVLIDWESARLINPTREMLLAALDWSDVAGNFNPNRFESMLTAYKAAGGIIEVSALQAAFDFILGDWLNWLIYNVAYSIDAQESERQRSAAIQIDLVFNIMQSLQSMRPELMAMAGLDLH